MQERSGVVTFMGRPVTLIGPEVRAGDIVSEFTVLANDLSEVTWRDLAKKTILFNVVPSLDTAVCSLQTRRFNEEAVTLPPTVEVVTISADLPFAQARFAVEAKITHRMLSDHRDLSFGRALGVGIKELRLLARSAFVVAPDGRVLYCDIVPEVTHHLNYSAALKIVS